MLTNTQVCVQTHVNIQKNVHAERHMYINTYTPTPTHTPHSTPRSTPAGTPAQSPTRGAVAKAKPPLPKREKKEKEEDPGVVLFTYKDSRLPKGKLNHETIIKFFKTQQPLKYIYRNTDFLETDLFKAIIQGKVNLRKAARITYVSQSFFNNLKNGLAKDFKGKCTKIT